MPYLSGVYMVLGGTIYQNLSSHVYVYIMFIHDVQSLEAGPGLDDLRYWELPRVTLEKE